MGNEKTGGPAFPRPLSQHDTRNPGALVDHQDGMTLRDYFAAKAMQALITKEGAVRGREGFGQMSYEIADGMLKHR